MTEDAGPLHRVIHLLGKSSGEERREFLLEMLVGQDAGARCAAAAALGSVGDLGPLAELLPTETNRFVRAVIEAHLRRPAGAMERDDGQ